MTESWVEVPQPPVKAKCKRCLATFGARPDDAVVVSPNGIEHIGADYGDTACGIDATVKDWWWPL